MPFFLLLSQAQVPLPPLPPPYPQHTPTPPPPPPRHTSIQQPHHAPLQAGDAADARADGDADADFAFALEDGVVQPRRRGRWRRAGGRRWRSTTRASEEAFADGLVVDEFLLGLHVADAAGGVGLAGQAAQRGPRRRRICSGGAEEEGPSRAGSEAP